MTFLVYPCCASAEMLLKVVWNNTHSVVGKFQVVLGQVGMIDVTGVVCDVWLMHVVPGNKDNDFAV